MALELSIHEAAILGRLDLVKDEIDSGIEVDMKNYKGFTPLMLAAFNGQREIVKYLILHGANVNELSNKKYSPLIAAVINDNVGIAKLLVENGADINLGVKEGFWPAVMYASSNGSVQSLYFLLRNYSNIYYIDEAGNTPFTVADNDKIVKMLNSMKSEIDELLRIAYNYLQKDKLELALEVYDELEPCLSNQPLIYYNRGYIYSITKEYDSALKNYKEALELTDDASYRANVNLEIGRIFSIRGEYDVAINHCNEVITYNPNNSYAYLLRGWNYQNLKEYNKGIADYSRALELEEELNEDVLLRRGNLYMIMDEYEEAIKDFDKLMEMDSKFVNQNFYNNRAYVLRKLGDYERALINIRKAIAIDDQNGVFFLTYAEINAYMDYKEGFYKNIDRAIELLDLTIDELIDKHYSDEPIIIELLENYSPKTADNRKVI